MGHYRSEMGYEAEDRAAEERAKVQFRRTKSAIAADIKKRGIEDVLTDIVLHPQDYKMRVY